METNTYFVEPILLHNADAAPPSFDGEIFDNRHKSYLIYDQPGVPKASIAVTGLNRLNKTKYCVECILKYVEDIDYELILIDNGSSDGTYEFFQSVPYKNKVIIKVDKNIGAAFPLSTVRKIYKGKYLVTIANDVYLTKNCLSNLLYCIESDPTIGYVMPMSSNVSNGQEVDLGFSDLEEMQQKAADFNRRDPSKWEERMRLISLMPILSREVIDTVGIFDPAFIHDFSEDDHCARIRRAGYKIILCGDAFIHHDHDFRNDEDKDPVLYQKSLVSGRAIFREKYHGIDAWDDIVNVEIGLLMPLDTIQFKFNVIEPVALCVDVRCGTPVLEIRNRLRKRGITSVRSYAYTTQPKYMVDLQAVATEVISDKTNYIQGYYLNNFFDIIAVGEPINTYDNPISFIQCLLGLLKPNGILLFKVRNTDDFNAFLRSTGLGGESDPDLPTCIQVTEIIQCIYQMGGCKDIQCAMERYNLSSSDQDTIISLLRNANPNANDDTCIRILVKNYCLGIVKE